MNDDESAGFYAVGNPGLARHGVPGHPLAVYCLGDTLLLRGDGGSELRLPATEIERLRLGFGDTKTSRYHMARVFLPGEAEPLLIRSRDSRSPLYAATMRRYAAAVVAARGPAALERGLTDGLARGTVLSGIGLAVVVTGLTLTVWRHEAGALGAIVFIGFLAGMAALLAWHAQAFEKPRVLGSLEEAEKYLR